MLDVLRSVDFSATKFGVLVVENNYLETGSEEFMFGKGCQKVERRFCDNIYIPVNLGCLCANLVIGVTGCSPAQVTQANGAHCGWRPMPSR